MLKAFFFDRDGVIIKNFGYVHKEKNVKWLMTQANTKQIRKIFKEYTIKTFDVYRAMKKEYVKELVIFNYQLDK